MQSSKTMPNMSICSSCWGKWLSSVKCEDDPNALLPMPYRGSALEHQALSVIALTGHAVSASRQVPSRSTGTSSTMTLDRSPSIVNTSGQICSQSSHPIQTSRSTLAFMKGFRLFPVQVSAAARVLPQVLECGVPSVSQIRPWGLVHFLETTGHCQILRK